MKQQIRSYIPHLFANVLSAVKHDSQNHMCVEFLEVSPKLGLCLKELNTTTHNMVSLHSHDGNVPPRRNRAFPSSYIIKHIKDVLLSNLMSLKKIKSKSL